MAPWYMYAWFKKKLSKKEKVFCAKKYRVVNFSRNKR
jgi:hypothetical protein